MLDLRSLTSHYGRIQALRDVNLRVGARELVAIVGANGAGKTTLLRAISGVQPISRGEIVLDGQPIQRRGAAERVARGIVHVPEGRQVFGPMTVEDNLRLGAYLRPRRELAGDLERVYALFPVLAERRRVAAGMLSGGQQQMLALGRAMMAHPRLLLLDEPSVGLAPRLVAEIYAHIQTLRVLGVTVLLVDQNARAALAIADRAYVIETGRVVMEGRGRDLADDPAVQAAYLGMDTTEPTPPLEKT